MHCWDQRRCTQETGETALHICASAGGPRDAARLECLEMLISIGTALDLPNKVRTAV